MMLGQMWDLAKQVGKAVMQPKYKHGPSKKVDIDRRGMMAIHNIDKIKIAFGRAPRDKYETDYIYVTFMADAIVDLTEVFEWKEYDDYRPHIKAENAKGKVMCKLHHLPIKDISVPRRDQQKAYKELVQSVAKDAKEGKAVYIHCKGGHGRSAMFFACVLIHIYPEKSAEEILKLTNEMHATQRTDTNHKWIEIGAPQTETQIKLVMGYHIYWQEASLRIVEKAKRKAKMKEIQDSVIRNIDEQAEKGIEKFTRNLTVIIRKTPVHIEAF